MKKAFYIFGALLIAAGISYSSIKFFVPILGIAQSSQDISVLLSVVSEMWQFLLLGFVIGGVITQIPRSNNDKILRFASASCIGGSCLMLSMLGLGLARIPYIHWIVLGISQTGLTLFYLGMAITLIEMLREIIRLGIEFWKS